MTLKKAQMQVAHRLDHLMITTGSKYNSLDIRLFSSIFS